MERKNNQLVEHLFRSEYGKILAILTRFFGPTHIELAEDVMQETLISALNNWGSEGVPTNPTGWLVQVAKRKALNELKRNEMIHKHHSNFPQHTEEEIGSIFLENEIEDNQLRMIFTCCHSSLDIKSQIALTLKTLCGFGVSEVSKALLTTESTINKRLFRAKEKIRNSQTPFDIPQGSDLEKKLEAVSLTLYLLFNEGYNASSGETVIQKELCLEAVRLTKLLAEHFKSNHKLSALLALMCFHTARFDARIDHYGAIILFEDQDRTLWNKDLINIGMTYLKASINDSIISSYHIESRIAAEHCLSPSFQETNWSVIHKQYILLHRLKPNPIIRFNLAIIESKFRGIEASLKLLKELETNQQLASYHLLPATQGMFHLELKNFEVALNYLQKSLELNPSRKEAAVIESKILECQNRSQ
ncbi:MAG: sigma-70 family RNA polymerase sigma factor [Cyclobacteriaceae bacterium]